MFRRGLQVLGPLLFLLYMADLFEVIAKHGARAHFYADDGQQYCTSTRQLYRLKTRSDSLRTVSCEVEAWMCASPLRLNPQKTQLIWLGSRQQLDKLNITDVQLLSTTLHPQSTVRMGAML